MADTKISSLPLTNSLTGAELVPMVKDGVTVASTAAQIATLAPNTGVNPGSYTNTNLTVDAKGRITAASSGSAGGGGGITALTGDATASGSGSVSVTVTKINGQTPATVATSGSYNDLTNKPALGTAASLAAGSPNGVATLDGSGKVPSSQLPATSNAVTSVAGKTGAVTLTSSDISGLAAVATSGLFSDITLPTSTLLGPAVSTRLASSASGYALNADGTYSTISNAPVGIHLRRAMELRSSAIRGRKQFASVGKVRARGGNARMLVDSDSTGVGGTTAGVRWPDQLANMMQGNLNANSNAKFGFNGTVIESREAITGCTRDATMTSLGGSSLKMTQAGDKLAITPDTVTDRCRVWYIQNTGAGSFSSAYNLGSSDLGAVTTSTAGTPGIASVVLVGSPGLATYNINWVSGALNIIGYECWNSALSSFEILNASFGGASTSDWAATTNPWSSQNAAVAIGADIYWIGTGINDTGGSTPISTYESRLQAMYTAFSGATSLITGAVGADVIFATGLAQNPNDTTPGTPHLDSIAKQETYVNSTLKIAYDNNCLAADMYRGLGLYAERIIADPSTDSWVHGGTITYTCMAQIAYMALVGDIGFGYGYTGSTAAATNHAKLYYKAIDTHRYYFSGTQLVGRGSANTSLVLGNSTAHATAAPFNTLIGDLNFNATSASDNNLVVGRGSFTRSVFGSNNLVIGYAVASNATTGLTGGSNNWLVGMDQTVTTPTTTTSSYWNLWNIIKGSVVAASGMLTSLVSWTIPGLQLGSSTISASASMVNNDYGIYADATSGNITYTLLTGAAYVGKILTVQKTDASANTVTIAGTINGTTNRVISAQNAGYQLHYASVALGWRITASF